MQVTADEMVVGYMIDTWGTRCHANGVTTYATTLASAMREVGTRAYLVALKVVGGKGDPNVLECPNWREDQGALGRVLVKIGGRLAPGAVELRRDAQSILSVVQMLHRGAGMQVFEMEEAHGTAGLLAASSPVPIVVRLHGPWLTTGLMVKGVSRRGFENRVRREWGAIQRAHGVSAVSRDVLDRVRSYYEMELPDAVVIPNPVRPVPVDERWSYQTCDPNRLLFVGRFDRHKGGDIAIQAFARVLQAKPQMRLTFVGPDRGCIDDNDRVWSLREYVQHCLPEPWMQGQFEWLGMRSQEEIHALRRASYAAVIASRYETFSMVTLESMAAGCPVIAPDVGGISDLVNNERNGLLFCAGDPADLAEKILTFMSQPGLATSLGRQAGIDAAEHYCPKTIAQRTLAYYREVIARSDERIRTQQWYSPQPIRV